MYWLVTFITKEGSVYDVVQEDDTREVIEAARFRALGENICARTITFQPFDPESDELNLTQLQRIANLDTGLSFRLAPPTAKYLTADIPDSNVGRICITTYRDLMALKKILKWRE